MEENTNSTIPFYFPKEYKSIVSIIGIGGGAGRIVNEMQVYKFLKRYLYVFDMNRKEMEELSLPHKYLIGTDELGNGKNKRFAESECKKTLQGLDRITSKILSCFIVCLGGGTGKGYIKTFLQKSVEIGTKLKLLVVTLPHASEGIEKRNNALRLLQSLEELVDAIYVVDYDTLPCNTLPGLFKEGNRRIIEFVKTLVGSIVNRGVLCFDFYDIGTFMRYNSDTRYVEYFSLSGDINYLKQAVNDLCKYLPPKYSSVHDISNMIILITLNNTENDTDRCFYDEVLSGIMHVLGKEAVLKWGLYNNLNMNRNIYQLDIFTKCN